MTEQTIKMPNGQNRILTIGATYLVNGICYGKLIRINENSGFFNISNNPKSAKYMTIMFRNIGNEIALIN